MDLKVTDTPRVVALSIVAAWLLFGLMFASFQLKRTASVQAAADSIALPAASACSPLPPPAGNVIAVDPSQARDLDDIVRIWRNGNHLWLVTSTFDENSRRVRVDIHDSEGKEKGRVLLQMPGGFELVKLSWHGMNLRNGKLYIFESSRDGDLELVCYGLKGVPDLEEGK